MTHGEFAVYCIDTSSLVDLWRWRPMKRHKEVWERVEKLIEDSRLVAPKMVLDELHRQDDELATWARGRKRGLFRRTSQDLVKLARKICNEFHGLVDPDQPFNSADPFVVALAVLESKAVYGQKVFVVTEERYAPDSPRIPRVCEAYGLKYLTIHQMFLFEGWNF